MTAIYPSADTLPENLLRFYLQFNQPMKTERNLEQIQLLDHDDQIVTGALFNNVRELWDPAQKQLTLIFDPGRVKTGLRAHESMGRALIPGQKYRLLIDNLQNVHHQPMTAPFVKSFVVGPADTIAPDLEAWVVKPPAAAGQLPLRVEFPGMLDQFSLHHRLLVLRADSTKLSGSIKLGNRERSWFFTPKANWQPGSYFLLVNGRLEDPAGNNLRGLFDHQTGTLRPGEEGSVFWLTFEVEHRR